MILACSVGLVDHGLDDPPPGVDEPEGQEAGSDIDLKIQKLHKVKRAS